MTEATETIASSNDTKLDRTNRRNRVDQRSNKGFGIERWEMARALIIEESPELRKAFSEFLQERGIETFTARGASDATTLLAVLKPEITVLDVDFRDGDALLLIEQIARVGSRCLIISDPTQIQVRIRVLSLGVDDYLGKPVDLEEFYLRIRNILRSHAQNNEVAKNTILDLNGVKVDLMTRTLLDKNGQPGAELTEHELSLLRMLSASLDRVVSKEILFEVIHHRPGAPTTRSLDVAISRLRIKLKSSDVGMELRSVRQVGYMLSRATGKDKPDA